MIDFGSSMSSKDQDDTSLISSLRCYCDRSKCMEFELLELYSLEELNWAVAQVNKYVAFALSEPGHTSLDIVIPSSMLFPTNARILFEKYL